MARNSYTIADRRRFVELVETDRLTKSAAFCRVTGREPSKATSAESCRWWNHPVCQEHLARLRGALSPQVINVPVEAVRAQWDRHKFVEYLQDTIECDPTEILGMIEESGSMSDLSKRLRQSQRNALQSAELTIAPDGTRKYKITLTPKASTAATLKAVQGFKEEKNLEDDFAALFRAYIKPTVGLHGERVNAAALAAQSAMSNPA